MTSLMFGVMGNHGVPVDEKVVRSTALPVEKDAPAAMESDVPQWNEPAETDQNVNLGMNTRTLASHWVEGEQSAPFWQGAVDQNIQHNALVDGRISSSGTAAQREAAGQFGHGTASYAIGIEPVGDLREGGAFGNEYFAAGKPDIQETAGNYMSVPPGYDQATTGKVAQTGKVVAHQAATSAYDAWWNGGN
jgi:hypothetical protein